MRMLQWVELFNLFIAVFFFTVYFYQLFYLAVGFVRRKRKDRRPPAYGHFAFVVNLTYLGLSSYIFAIKRG